MLLHFPSSFETAQIGKAVKLDRCNIKTGLSLHLGLGPMKKICLRTETASGNPPSNVQMAFSSTVGNGGGGLGMKFHVKNCLKGSPVWRR